MSAPIQTMEAGPSIEVPKPLDADQENFFVDNGYLAVADMVNADID